MPTNTEATGQIKERPAIPHERSRQALDANEHTFHALAETATDAVVLADSEGNITYWNGTATRMFGYTSREALAKPVTLIIPERFRVACQQGIERHRKTGEARVIGKTVELAGRRKDATEFPLELSLSAWKSGKSVFFAAVIRDITKRKHAEEALRLLLEGLKGRAVYMLNPEGRVASWNPEAEGVTGYDPEEVMGQDFSLFYSAEDIQRGKPKHALTAAATQGPFEEEGWLVKKDGSRFWAAVRIVALKDQGGQLLGFVKTVRDYTG